VVCAWIGNSRPADAKHYLQVADAHFDQAAEEGPPAALSTPAAPAESPSVPSDLAGAWGDLPEHVKAAILALAGSAAEKVCQKRHALQ